MKKVEIYTTQWCPYCHAAKSLLDEKGVSYEAVSYTHLTLPTILLV